MHAQISQHPGLLGRLAEAVAAAQGRRRRAAERRGCIARVARELEAYSDSELADLGIGRCDIHRIARETVDGTPA